MNKKERALHTLESELDSISQSIYCSNICFRCPFSRRIKKLQGKVRILMDYGYKAKNTTLTTFKIKKWGAGKRRATRNNQRARKQPCQKELFSEL